MNREPGDYEPVRAPALAAQLLAELGRARIALKDAFSAYEYEPNSSDRQLWASQAMAAYANAHSSYEESMKR